ncbi:TPA: Paratox [Streptococcus suis]|uniref:competence regulator inhibitor paratox n=1 Tax=Streptococcus suis TaxID=1307 RepID=UPI000945D5B3|nr:Paratox [Streptococcus suis]HEM3871190.1 Paratox [Streptococcus suis]HEM3922073.1 Paratox [Streptococcus suis]
MLEYEELKQAVDGGYIQGETVMIVRRDGKIFDYVLPGEPVRPWEIVSEEKLVDVMRELKKTLSKICPKCQKNSRKR